MRERIAIVPGSFDPITNGHIEIIKKASQMYDRVFVAVMINDQKQYMFNMEERKSIAEVCLEDIENVEVISSDGWLWMLAKELNACAIVKGYRNDIDLAYEQKMAEFNAEHYPDAKTVLIKADDSFTTLSSTVVRERIVNNLPLQEYLPQKAIDMINKIKRQKWRTCDKAGLLNE